MTADSATSYLLLSQGMLPVNSVISRGKRALCTQGETVFSRSVAYEAGGHLLLSRGILIVGILSLKNDGGCLPLMTARGPIGNAMLFFETQV